MKNPNYYVALDDAERTLLLGCLSDFRNHLIAEGRYTDAVDEVIIKVSRAKIRKFKIVYGVCKMEPSLFEQMGGTYRQVGDYLIPDLELPEEESIAIGVWGKRRRRYLREHRNILYTNLLTSGKLNSHLVDIDNQAEAMFSRLVEQMAEQENVTEQLKAENPMQWIGCMNNIRNRAMEIVNTELIF